MRIPGLALALSLLAACAHGRSPYPTADSSLELDRVVLYRNGVGYFERRGEVRGDTLVLRVRKDQVNDLLKSLTVVDRAGGKAVSVSMPLDPQTWANAALATLAPGQGSLAQVLDALRGTSVVLGTTQGKLRGRIVMVEEIVDEPDASPPPHSERTPLPTAGSRDFKVTVLDGKRMQVVRLSKVRSVTLQDGDLALQLHRSLDASAGEGMFQQVAVELRLAGAANHDLVVSYVVAAPMWKPTYRVVLPEAGDKSPALLQGWAIVDNTSGDEWTRVSMSLTSGAPIAFRYDLHTPRQIQRSAPPTARTPTATASPTPTTGARPSRRPATATRTRTAAPTRSRCSSPSSPARSRASTSTRTAPASAPGHGRCSTGPAP